MSTKAANKVAQAPPPKTGETPPKPQPPPSKILARINENLKLHGKQNRASDLVSLQREFQTFRNKLKDMIVSLKNYPTMLRQADKARLELKDKLVALAKNSPIEESIGGSSKESMSSVSQKLSSHWKDCDAAYKDKLIKYAVEWESVVTSTVDKEVAANDKLHAKLDHYNSKVEGLRKKTNKILEAEQARAEKKKETTKKSVIASPAVPEKLRSKLERNENKLTHAWNQHERSASALCNLLEEVTILGWNDLYPLLLDLMQWEIERSAADYDLVAELIAVRETITKTYEIEKQKHKRVLEEKKFQSKDEESVASLSSDTTSDSKE